MTNKNNTLEIPITTLQLWITLLGCVKDRASFEKHGLDVRNALLKLIKEYKAA